MNAILRVGGLAALAGGILRIANIVMTTLPQDTLAAVYFVTDILLLSGIAGLWFSRRAAIGNGGAAGLAIAVFGILIIRASAFGVGSYTLGALVVLIGLAVYSVDALVRRATPIWAPVCWLTALPPALTAGAYPGSLVLPVLATVLFGTGFVFTGLDLLRASRTDVLAARM